MNPLPYLSMNKKVILGFVLAAGLTARLAAESSVDSIVTTNLLEPLSVVSTTDGTLYISDGANHRIVKFDASTSAFSVLAGMTQVSGTNNGIGVQARFYQVEGLVQARGGLVVADSGNQLIRFVSLNGAVTTLAGGPRILGANDGAGSVARFRYPLGLAADAEGNVFIADSKNNAIRKLSTNNVVSTVAAGFYEPAAVAVGANGDLWVADTRRNMIKRIDTNGVITVMAGLASGQPGYLDSIVASESLLNTPRGLLWLGAGAGLLISDSGNNVVRRLYYNSAVSDWSIETIAGVAGPGGLLNGSAASALFSAPIGLCRDLANGGFYVADRANKHIRRISTDPPLPAITDPSIGYVILVKDAFGSYVTTLIPVTSAVFNNPVVVAILGEPGTETYYTSGETPSSSFEDTIPSPGPGTGMTAPAYRNGRPPSEMPATIMDPQPDVTIKAIGVQDGRRSSGVASARFQFKVGNPSISGDNAAFFSLDTATDGAAMYYTIDGSEPTNSVAANPAVRGPVYSGETISLVVQETNLVFKARGYRSNFKPSDVSTKIFTPSNFVANSISLGFDGGEASSDFLGAAGQRFFAPVTLSVLKGIKMYSLQFNVVVTNQTTAPGVDGSLVRFDSMLMKPLEGGLYTVIPPAMSVADKSGVFADLLFTNAPVNLLGVGWLERLGKTNLYNTLGHDLITYSQAHDTLFLSADGKVVLGAYSFLVPTNSALGDRFSVKLGRPSATADGIGQDVYIAAPTNGSLLVERSVKVSQKHYVVGDPAPFRWFNAGDFGNTNLLNNDVMQVFQSAVYFLNYPPFGSDFYDSMDSCCNGADGLPLPADVLWNGNDNTIDQVVFGDNSLQSEVPWPLDVNDVFVTFRRSLDPNLAWYARYWSNGVRHYVAIKNGAPAGGGAKSAAAKSAVASAPAAPVRASIWAEDIVTAGRTTVQVPIRARIDGTYPMRVLMLNLSVQPLDGAPELTDPVTFAASASLGAPSVSMSKAPYNFAGAWLNNTVAGVTGTNIIGTLTVVLPPGTPAHAAYRVHFDHFSASPNGLASFACATTDGLIAGSDLSGSSWADGIPDSWRLRFFGSLSNLLSAAAADADGDGFANLTEYKAGTNPNDASSTFKLLSSALSAGQGAGVHLKWPTGLNRRYVLEYSTDFGSGKWYPLSTNILGGGGMTDYIDVFNGSTGAATRFYRVRAVE